MSLRPSLIPKVSSETNRATQRDPVSKQTNKNTQKNQPVMNKLGYLACPWT